MSSFSASKFLNTAVPTLFVAPLLFVSTIFSAGLFGVEGPPTALGAAHSPALADQRVAPLRVDYQVIDPGEADLTEDKSPSSVTNDYPAPSLRGYPAAVPFKQVRIRHNVKEAIRAVLDELALLFGIEAGTVDTESEMQIYKLKSLHDTISYRVVGGAFSIQFTDENGDLIGAFNKPIKITFSLGLSGASTQNSSSTVMKPHQWDQSSATWKRLEYEVNTEDNTITATITEPGEVALLRNVQIFVPSIQQ